MLNVAFIKQRMRDLGLTGQDVARACDVTKQAVSSWWNGAVPRPATVVQLADALKAEIDQLLVPLEEPAPVVAYRMRQNRKPTAAAKEAGEDVARHLQQLAPLAGGETFFTHRRIPDHLLKQECVAEAASAARSLLRLAPTETVTHHHLFDLFKRIGVVVIPVFWGGDKDGHENAMSVYLPDSGTTWMLFNLGCKLDDLSYWLAHELGHSVSLHVLQEDEGEAFAERFAQELLFPKAVALEALEQIRASAHPMDVVTWFAGKYQVSVVAVVKAADRVAKEAGEEATGLATPQFYAKWKLAGARRPSAALELLGTEEPAPMEYVIKSEEFCGTPIFQALAKFQRLDGRRNPAFVSAALNIEVGAGVALSQALWERGA